MHYGLSLVTPAAVAPLTLGEIRRHLRIDGTTEDSVLTALLASATEYYQRQTLLQLLPATYDLTLDRFPRGRGFIRLPRAPVASLTSITYRDTAGANQTLASSRTVLQSDRLPAELRLDFAETWPATNCGDPSSVTIRFVAGYATPAEIPAIHKAALHLLVGAWYEHREELSDGKLQSLPLGAERIIVMEALGDLLSLGIVDC